MKLGYFPVKFKNKKSRDNKSHKYRDHLEPICLVGRQYEPNN